MRFALPPASPLHPDVSHVTRVEGADVASEDNQMSDDTTTGTQAGTESTDEGGSGLRKQLETVLAENKALKGQLRTTAFKTAGFDPDTGPGKALAKLYDGEPDVDAIRAFAKDEFGFEPDGSAAAPDPAAARQAGEERLATVSNSALPARDPSLDGEIAEAEASGNWDLADRLKVKKLEKARRAS